MIVFLRVFYIQGLFLFLFACWHRVAYAILPAHLPFMLNTDTQKTSSCCPGFILHNSHLLNWYFIPASTCFVPHHVSSSIRPLCQSFFLFFHTRASLLLLLLLLHTSFPFFSLLSSRFYEILFHSHSHLLYFDVVRVNFFPSALLEIYSFASCSVWAYQVACMVEMRSIQAGFQVWRQHFVSHISYPLLNP